MEKSNNKVEYEIDDVYTIFHGSPNSISMGSSTFLTTNRDDSQRISISNLDKKKISALHLSSCNNGNLDFLNNITINGTSYTQNMAITFLKEMNDIECVWVWDGLATYVPVLSGIEYASTSREFPT